MASGGADGDRRAPDPTAVERRKDAHQSVQMVLSEVSWAVSQTPTPRWLPDNDGTRPRTRASSITPPIAKCSFRRSGRRPAAGNGLRLSKLSTYNRSGTSQPSLTRPRKKSPPLISADPIGMRTLALRTAQIKTLQCSFRQGRLSLTPPHACTTPTTRRR